MNTNKKNFLFATWEGGGNVPPVLTVARKLRERGHIVRLMSDEANRADAEAAGIGFHPWQTAPNRADKTAQSCPLRDWEAGSPQEGIGRVLDHIIFGPALEYARDIAKVLDREPADLVITSDMLAGVLTACEGLGQAVAVLAANLCLYPFEGMHVFGPGLPPPRNPEQSEIHAQLRAGLLAMLNSRLDALNRARMAFGLLPLDSVMKHLDVASRYFLATSRAFDYPVDKHPPQIRYVGPQLDEPAWIESWHSPWPMDDPRPLILVAFSTTYQAHERALQRVIDAAASLPVRLLVTLGQVSPESLTPAANTVLVRNAPHDAVMRQTTLVVTHGGHGTVMRALHHHLPMLVMPHGRDQDENAARVAEHGVGIRLSAMADTEQIHEALRRLLDEPAFAESARRLGREIADESAQVDVVRELEVLAKPSSICACEI